MDASSVEARSEISRDEFVELAATVRDLAQRVSLLEHPPAVATTSESVSPPEIEFSSDLVPAIGRSLLAIAGAYVLRLLSELTILPPRVGIAAGIVYAAVWLWFATRTKARVTTTLYTIASMLILAPLLWEATVRLHAAPAWIAAAVVAIFAIGGSLNKSVAAISTTACAVIAMVLLIAVHDLVPFTFALLAIAAAAEFSGVASRWTAAFLADAGVAIFTILLAKGLPQDYPPAPMVAAVSAQVLLLAIYGVNLLARRRAYSVYEMAQFACALTVGAGGALYLTRANTPIASGLLLGSVACYALTYFRSAPQRNQRLLAVFSLILALAGTYLWVSGIGLTIIWCALGVAAACIRPLAFQSPVYLLGATLLSNLAVLSASRIWDGSPGTFPVWEAAIVFAAAFASYLLLAHGRGRFLALEAAAIGLFVGVSIACLAVPGTFVLVPVAGLLAGFGARSGRRELVWLMYPLMLIAAVKILLRDSWQQSTLSLVVSLLVYGLALILIPKILSTQRRASNRAF